MSDLSTELTVPELAPDGPINSFFSAETADTGALVKPMLGSPAASGGGLGTSVKNALSEAQTAIVSPLQKAGSAVAAKLGARNPDAVGAWLLPVVLVGAFGVVIVWYVVRGRHRKVSL